MFELVNVVKRYRQTLAVDSVDLNIAAGQTTVLIGPSGCGKSTLLRMMVGLVVPDGGEVRFAGESITPANALRLRRRMGYSIQDGGLFPHLTARDNILLLSRHLGRPKQEMAARLADLVKLMNFTEAALNQYPVQLSGGQRQRVSLMRALLLDPECLLLDEPLGALDPLIRADLQRDLRDIFATLGKTVVMVTHDLAEAAVLGHTLVALRRGHIEQQGSAAEVLGAPATPFVQQFVAAQRPWDEMK